MSKSASQVRDDVAWGRVLSSMILGVTVMAFGVWGLRTESVAAKWPGSDPPVVVDARLEAMVVHDHKWIEKHLVGKWVPQLSGVTDTHWKLTASTTRAHDLFEHEALRKKYRAQLIRSDDYNFEIAGRYISIVPKGFKSAKQALGWCRKAHLGPDRCIAKRLTHGSATRTVLTG